MKRRVRLSSKEFQELVTAHRWCKLKGFEGLAEYYDDYLTFLHKRRALPPEAYQGEPDAE
jgi:hypothetical protein